MGRKKIGRKKTVRKNKQTEKVYCSLEELKEDLLPNLHKEELKEKRLNKPELYGTSLATEILEKIKQQMHH